MKLNPDCIRGILLTVEEKCDYDTYWTYEQDNFESECLAEYSHEEIIYHITQASQSGLIQGVLFLDAGDSVTVGDLTPFGHEFLANIRTDTLWNKIKSKAFGASLPLLSEIAQKTAREYFLK